MFLVCFTGSESHVCLDLGANIFPSMSFSPAYSRLCRPNTLSVSEAIELFLTKARSPWGRSRCKYALDSSAIHTSFGEHSCPRLVGRKDSYFTRTCAITRKGTLYLLDILSKEGTGAGRGGRGDLSPQLPFSPLPSAPDCVLRPTYSKPQGRTSVGNPYRVQRDSCLGLRFAVTPSSLL